MAFRPINTGKIVDNIYTVRCGIVNMYLIKNNEKYICVDAGLKNGMLVKGLEALGIDPASVTHILLTHTDSDHTGGIELFKNAGVYISADEEQMITRKAPRAFGLIYNRPIQKKYNLLQDGQSVNIEDMSIKAILTPGHTKGSMSYLVNGKYLFTGDTLSLKDGEVTTFPSFINMDTKIQKQSIQKLAQLMRVEAVFTAHTGYCDNFEIAMKNWI